MSSLRFGKFENIVKRGKFDKATMEFESFYSGTLLHIGLNEGDSAKVDSLLAVIGPSGTDISSILENPVTSKIDNPKEVSIVQEETSEPVSEPKKVIEKVAVSNNKRIFIHIYTSSTLVCKRFV